MKTRTKITAAGVAAVLLIGAAIGWSWANREPVYKGKRVRTWLFDNRFIAAHLEERDQALRFFGTNSVPCVRARLRARDTWIRGALVWFSDEGPWLRMRVYPARDEHILGLIALNEILKADDWGDARNACVPELRALTNDPLDVRVLATNLLYIIARKEREGKDLEKP